MAICTIVTLIILLKALLFLSLFLCVCLWCIVGTHLLSPFLFQRIIITDLIYIYWKIMVRMREFFQRFSPLNKKGLNVEMVMRGRRQKIYNCVCV